MFKIGADEIKEERGKNRGINEPWGSMGVWCEEYGLWSTLRIVVALKHICRLSDPHPFKRWRYLISSWNQCQPLALLWWIDNSSNDTAWLQRLELMQLLGPWFWEACNKSGYLEAAMQRNHIKRLLRMNERMRSR